MSTDAKPPGRMPVVYFPHGGGPWPFVDLGFPSRAERADLIGYLGSLRSLPPTEPRALLVISAHWEARVPTVMTAAAPPILYDYYGFPPESYAIPWPAPGSPALASRVRALLGAVGIASDEDPRRGFDHGTFVPLKLTYPDAAIPTIQLSLVAGLDPSVHLAIGRALAPLRDEGVFLLGSGSSFHNLRARGAEAVRAASEFDAWLKDASTRPAQERDDRLVRWAEAPSARAAHPREEHLLPLMVIAGAAGEDRGSVAWNGRFGGVPMSAVAFGASG